ncbi:fumarylacetoacetate hydrolase family protein [Clostridium sp. PL3]|uniref:Fumarylacetoacetate hydrolase family protein n=1 Tax=Clostridium thailandense TaxID=2794346 RepID=A0A949TWW5_9CLOT|nr:fumarylacetoacetate hydrolase family protein [Clostridium thailandense]MBV7276747.1 fumarylacetoacetate hydrolase family protein [Clostridium thailandense]
MKLVNFKVGEQIKLGIKNEQGIIDVAKVAEDHSIRAYAIVEEVIEGGEKALSELSQLIQKETNIIPEKEIIYAPPVIKPEKILCIALNYREAGKDIPKQPIIFSKFNNTLAAHDQIVSLPQNAEKFDYEAELVIVMGKEAKNISKEEALNYIFGYTAGNDLAARELQCITHQWLLGKTCDHFAPIGPYLVTADEIDTANLEIKCKVNGALRQNGNTRDMVLDCAAIVSYISSYMTLKPGDIIFTGTPSGAVSTYPEDKQQWLKSGDEIVVSIEKIGELINVLK